MPDWFYRTVSRPLLFALPAATARDLALGFMGRLVRSPGGPLLIDVLGHMRADPRLQCELLGVSITSSVGLGPLLDTKGVALPAVARFGFGFLEVGPIGLTADGQAGPIERLASAEALRLTPQPRCSLEQLLPRVHEAAALDLPLLLRLTGPLGDAADARLLIHPLAPHAAWFSLDSLRSAIAEAWPVERWQAYLAAMVDACRTASPPRPLLLVAPSDLPMTDQRRFIQMAIDAGVQGLIVDGMVMASLSDAAGGLLAGLPARQASLTQVRSLRSELGPAIPLMASGGVHEPADAIDLFAAGADAVLVDTGLIFTGPGLPKRINDALLHSLPKRLEPLAAVPAGSSRPAEATWFWTLLLGLAMLGGSLLTLSIAATRVLLPYDEAFVGMSRQQLHRINPRLLEFMAHDRVSLAGAMVSIGVLYIGLSLYGVRQGLHWARQAIFVSASAGFVTFFLFLGFGYLDTLHAFVTAVLLQLLLMAVHSRLGSFAPLAPPIVRNTRRWRWSLWGQLLLLVHSGALILAGLVIACIGVTHVFVHEDLEFMQTTAEALYAANPRLIPLIAHDRATLGGMLLSNGLAYLLIALWGYRNSSAWLCWTLLLAALSAYASAIGVHFVVGYTDPAHLLPAFAGLGLFLLGLGLSAPYLCAHPADDVADRLKH